MASWSLIFVLLAVIGAVSSRAFPSRSIAELLNPSGTVIKDVFKKFPKKFNSKKDAIGEGKDTLNEDKTLAADDLFEDEGEPEGPFRVPIYRQDLFTSPDSSSDTPRFAIYSRYPGQGESFPTDERDNASYNKTLKFIEMLRKQNQESSTRRDPEESDPEDLVPEESHPVYTSESEIGGLGMTRNEESLLTSFRP